MDSSAQFRPYFELVNPIGESSREKTRTEGEILRGRGGILALFLCIPVPKVRVFGSEAAFRAESKVDGDELADRCLPTVRKFGRSGFVACVVHEMHLVWIKGEVFQESLGCSAIVKVRKYRTKMASIARKSPTDAAEVVCVLRSLKSKGEIFQDGDGRDQKYGNSPKSALR
jgi:hypothetical protein